MNSQIFKIMKLALLLSAFFAVVLVSAEQEILRFRDDQHLAIHRNFVDPTVAKKLQEDLLSDCIPDEISAERVFKFKGDAGAESSGPGVVPTKDMLRDMIYDNPPTKTSVVFLVENLSGSTYARSKELIHSVVPNSVLEDNGTIHLYMSPPATAALANHTDTTDIFVLQLDGNKEWLLCEENELEKDRIGDKLNKCTTYNEQEISRMKCMTTTLFPGDALFLPRKVVHSARSSENKPSVHLTFGFAATQCLEGEKPRQATHLRTLQTTCNAVDGGSACNGNCNKCNSGCDEACVPCEGSGCSQLCETDCDVGCPSGCNKDEGGLLCTDGCTAGCDSSCDRSCDFLLSSCDDSCDHSCDDNCNTVCKVCFGCPAAVGGSECDGNCKVCTKGCDENCNDDCNTSCDFCPPSPTPPPTRSPTNAPTFFPTRSPVAEPSFLEGLLGSCFPGEASVEVLNRGKVLMRNLEIGDAILQVHGGYSTVYSFAHKKTNDRGAYIQVTTSPEKTLEISPDHLIFMRRTIKGHKQLVPAKQLQTGQFLVTKDDLSVKIVSLKTVDRNGLYAPLTYSGRLVVNGVEASSYVSREWVPTDKVSCDTLAMVQHFVLLPLRLYCTAVRSCKNETYSDDFGLNPYVLFWLKVEESWFARVFATGLMVKSNLGTSIVIATAIAYFVFSVVRKVGSKEKKV